MAEDGRHAGTPASILLATDLSARCDRALDRAARLARYWKARLVALHVIELQAGPVSGEPWTARWGQAADPLAIAEAEMRADLPEEVGSLTTLIKEGDPATIAARVAAELGCGLVVTGLARSEPLGRFGPGSTVTRLARLAEVPILVVRDRARCDYRSVLVATDCSEASRHALRAAVRLFPENTPTLVYAYETPFTTLIDNKDSYRHQYANVAAGHVREFLAETSLPPGISSRVKVLAEEGMPMPVVRRCASAMGADLVVLGTRGRGAVMDFLLGSVAREILGALPCDALLVPLRDADEGRGADLTP